MVILSSYAFRVGIFRYRLTRNNTAAAGREQTTAINDILSRGKDWCIGVESTYHSRGVVSKRKGIMMSSATALQLQMCAHEEEEEEALN